MCYCGVATGRPQRPIAPPLPRHRLHGYVLPLRLQSGVRFALKGGFNRAFDFASTTAHCGTSPPWPCHRFGSYRANVRFR